MPPILGCTFFNSPPIFFPKFRQHFLPLPLLRAKFLPLRYIHKGVSLMLVFGFLKRRKFQTGSKTMQKTMLRVWYKHSVGVHWGNFVPAHFCGLYTRNVGVSLLVYPMVFLHHKNGRVKVQIPTFFVCGCRITD